MAILSEQIAIRIKGTMAENEDWWRLCYDTDAKAFYVEHEWSHTSLSALSTDGGKEQHDADTWTGAGADQIAAAKLRLLEQANA